MRSLVTGGAGFIGSHLVDRLLADGDEVVVLDSLLCGDKLDPVARAAVRFVEGDVRDARTVEGAALGCDRVFHLAAVLGVDVVAERPVETMETEVLGARNVVHAALRQGCERVVYASTSGVYGQSAFEAAVEEDFDVSPRSSYAIAKRYNELYLKSVFQEEGLPSASLRFFNVYGPRQDERMVIPRFLALALAGEPLTVFGTGAQTRDFTWIGDVVEAIVGVAPRFEGAEIYNVSTGRETTIGATAERIVALTDSASPVLRVHPPDGRYDFEVERRVGSSEKLQALTGFAPAVVLEVGLRRILAAAEPALARR